MTLNANKVSGGGPVVDPVDQGTYPARLVQVIGLGLQEQRPYKGEAKPPAHEVNYTYELVDEFMKDEEGNDNPEKPRWISETLKFYPLSSDKAVCTKRYLALDPKQEQGGDWVALLETPCMVTVVHNKSNSNGKTYANIANVAPMRDKDAAKLQGLVNPARSFDPDEPDLEVFESLPSFLKTKITSNLEFEGSALQKALGTEGPAKAADAGEDMDDALDGDENPY